MDGHFTARRQPAGAGALAVQPRVSSAELAEFDARVDARRLARLLADQEIMLRLSVEGFDGVTWRDVSEALVEYGWAVMTAWIVTGQVFTKCRQKGLGGNSLEPPDGGLRRDDAVELAVDTVADAIVNFRDEVLAKGKWDPTKGASLSTYFVGNCLLRFVNRYRRWRAQRRGRRPEKFDHCNEHSADPADVVVRDERLASILSKEGDPTNRAIVQLRADGYSLDEIAEVLDKTYKQIESRLYRTRRRIGQHQAATR